MANRSVRADSRLGARRSPEKTSRARSARFSRRRLMLRESFGLEIEAQWIETAVDRVLDHGYRTMDIAEPGGRILRVFGIHGADPRRNARRARPPRALRLGRLDSLVLSQDQAARDHVVQRLLLFRESRHDVTDAQRNQARDDFREETPVARPKLTRRPCMSVTISPSAIFPSVA